MTVPVNVLASIAWICVCSRGEAMSRKALLWIFAAACFPLLQSQALAANTSEALVDDFLRKSGLWAQLAQIEPGVQLGIEQGDGQMRQLNDEQLGHLRDAARVAYGADRLRKAMRAELVSALPASDAEQALQFLMTDLGRRVTSLEEAAASPADSNHIEAIATQAEAALTPSRRELIQRMIKATRIVDVAASIVINQQLGVMRGFAYYAGRADSSTTDDVKTQMDVYRDQMVGALAPRLTAHAAVIYGPLSEDELVRYVAFLESPAGQTISRVTSAALDRVLAAAAFELGRRIGDAVKPADAKSIRL
jgi:hypothetical protein